jgi:hypothetical protein
MPVLLIAPAELDEVYASAEFEGRERDQVLHASDREPRR